jgi:hypothetical protein
MPAKKYLAVVAGRETQANSVVTSTGAANDGDLVALDAQGKIDVSILPAGVGVNTISGVASEALLANDIVNLVNNAGAVNVRKADNTAIGREAMGFVKAAFASGATATVFTSGNIITGLTGLTPGARQYLSATAGTRTETPPATGPAILQMLGYASSATSFIFEPEDTITLIA